jgi:hypothetical protein
MSTIDRPCPDAEEIARLVAETEQLLRSTAPVYETNHARTRTLAEFKRIMSNLPDGKARIRVLIRACSAIMLNGDPERPDAPLGDPDSFIVRLACLDYLASEAMRAEAIDAARKAIPALSLSQEAMHAAQLAYVGGRKMGPMERSLVLIDPDMPLKLPMTHPSRQALYADAEA